VLRLGGGRGRAPPRPAAIAAFSGFLPTVEGWELDDEAPFPPVALAHGTYDPIIPVEFGRSARDRLAAAGADVLWRESPMQHSIDPAFVRDVQSWLANVLG
jgi:phospholipase/carboxylesterase